MDRTCALFLALLATTLALAPSQAATGDEDLAWLADRLDVAPEDLPEALPGTSFRVDAIGVTTWETQVPVTEVAAALRGATAAQPSDHDAEEPRPPSFMGMGVANLTGQEGTAGEGVRWYGGALGLEEMPCIEVKTLVDPELEVPENGVTQAGSLLLGVSAELPTAEEGALSLVGVARMDQMLHPDPTEEGPTRVEDVHAVELPAFVGTGTTVCRMTFSLRISFATISGDGVILG